MVKPQGAIILVGAGKMGGALLEGWLAQGIKANRIKVIEANAAQATLLAERYLLEVSPNVGALSLTVPPAAVILAVKPQQMAVALQI
jgi:pyrroline-5-carboxylate reductase